MEHGTTSTAMKDPTELASSSLLQSGELHATALPSLPTLDVAVAPQQQLVDVEQAASAAAALPAAADLVGIALAIPPGPAVQQDPCSGLANVVLQPALGSNAENITDGGSADLLVFTNSEQQWPEAVLQDSQHQQPWFVPTLQHIEHQQQEMVKSGGAVPSSQKPPVVAGIHELAIAAAGSDSANAMTEEQLPQEPSYHQTEEHIPSAAGVAVQADPFSTQASFIGTSAAAAAPPGEGTAPFASAAPVEVASVEIAAIPPLALELAPDAQLFSIYAPAADLAEPAADPADLAAASTLPQQRPCTVAGQPPATVAATANTPAAVAGDEAAVCAPAAATSDDQASLGVIGVLIPDKGALMPVADVAEVGELSTTATGHGTAAVEVSAEGTALDASQMAHTSLPNDQAPEGAPAAGMAAGGTLSGSATAAGTAAAVRPAGRPPGRVGQVLPAAPVTAAGMASGPGRGLVQLPASQQSQLQHKQQPLDSVPRKRRQPHSLQRQTPEQVGALGMTHQGHVGQGAAGRPKASAAAAASGKPHGSRKRSAAGRAAAGAVTEPWGLAMANDPAAAAAMPVATLPQVRAVNPRNLPPMQQQQQQAFGGATRPAEAGLAEDLLPDGNGGGAPQSEEILLMMQQLMGSQEGGPLSPPAAASPAVNAAAPAAAPVGLPPVALGPQAGPVQMITGQGG
eukprot:gene8800-8979_t